MKIVTIPQSEWKARSNSSFCSPLTQFTFHDMEVIGYSTTRWRCTRKGCTISNKVDSLIIKKKLKSGSLSKNNYLYDLQGNEYGEFMELFRQMPEYDLYQEIQQEVAKDIFSEYPDWRMVPSHVSRHLQGDNWEYYYALCMGQEMEILKKREEAKNRRLQYQADMYRDQDYSGVFDSMGRSAISSQSNSDVTETISDKEYRIAQLNKEILNRNSFEDMWPEKEERDKLMREVSSLRNQAYR